MDKTEALRLATAYANRVKLKYDFTKVFLFGSYARGNYHKESDIDVAVILEDFRNLNEIQLDLMRMRRKIDSRIEPHPIRKKDFNINNPIANEIIKYGYDIKTDTPKN
ncbi:MAG: nucleotidyltransferase domain-containing protein [Bacteroidota bacterium]